MNKQNIISNEYHKVYMIVYKHDRSKRYIGCTYDIANRIKDHFTIKPTATDKKSVFILNNPNLDDYYLYIISCKHSSKINSYIEGDAIQYYDTVNNGLNTQQERCSKTGLSIKFDELVLHPLTKSDLNYTPPHAFKFDINQLVNDVHEYSLNLGIDDITYANVLKEIIAPGQTYTSSIQHINYKHIATQVKKLIRDYTPLSDKSSINHVLRLSLIKYSDYTRDFQRMFAKTKDNIGYDQWHLINGYTNSGVNPSIAKSDSLLTYDYGIDDTPYTKLMDTTSDISMDGMVDVPRGKHKQTWCDMLRYKDLMPGKLHPNYKFSSNFEKKLYDRRRFSIDGYESYSPVYNTHPYAIDEFNLDDFELLPARMANLIRRSTYADIKCWLTVDDFYSKVQKRVKTRRKSKTGVVIDRPDIVLYHYFNISHFWKLSKEDKAKLSKKTVKHVIDPKISNDEQIYDSVTGITTMKSDTFEMRKPLSPVRMVEGGIQYETPKFVKGATEHDAVIAAMNMLISILESFRSEYNADTYTQYNEHGNSIDNIITEWQDHIRVLIDEVKRDI